MLIYILKNPEIFATFFTETSKSFLKICNLKWPHWFENLIQSGRSEAKLLKSLAEVSHIYMSWGKNEQKKASFLQ